MDAANRILETLILEGHAICEKWRRVDAAEADWKPEADAQLSVAMSLPS
jgi:hypothetical protein